MTKQEAAERYAAVGEATVEPRRWYRDGDFLDRDTGAGQMLYEAAADAGARRDRLADETIDRPEGGLEIGAVALERCPACGSTDFEETLRGTLVGQANANVATCQCGEKWMVP